MAHAAPDMQHMRPLTAGRRTVDRQQQVAAPAASCCAPSHGCRAGRSHNTMRTLKCSSLPGGWLPSVQPQFAATVGSLKVVQCLERLPARPSRG